MASLIFSRCALFLAAVLTLAGRPGAAQTSRRYTDRVVSFTNTANPAAATGSDPTTQATLSPSLVVGGAALRLGFAAVNPLGSKAGLLINSGGVLAAAALSGLAINTYLAPSNTPQETMQLSQLLSLQVLNSGQARAEFTASKAFDQLELVAGGVVNGYSLGLVNAYADVAAPLPVALVAFQGRATTTGVQLTWRTASELNNSYFVVERATGSEGAAFTEVGRVAGAGSSQGRSYQYLDTTPEALGYYRLRQVDTDGQAHFSPVVAVQATLSTALAVYPSPAAATLSVAGPAASLGLFNQQGQLVRQLALSAEQRTVDVSSLPAGVYYLRDAATGQSTRFVKMGGQ